MIAFGASVAEPDPYGRYAEPGIRRAAEPDSVVHAFAATGSISRTYNLLLDAVAAEPDLEALVLVHVHAEIADARFCEKVRAVLQDPEIAVAGCAGATGVRSIAWWEGAVRAAPGIHRYEEHGGGELPAFSWTRPLPPPGDVDAVDGSLLVLSPWAVRTVRFDEELRLGHGFDLDYCLQVRAAGRRVVVADLRAIQHRSLELVGDLELWMEAHVQVAAKWDGQLSGAVGPDAGWRWRARRAEAEREAARAMAHSNGLKGEARVRELERAMAALIESPSWRLTAPLRRLNRARSSAARRVRRRDR